MERIEAELVLDLKMTLGEGPLWHPTEQLLYFTDIKDCKLYRYDPQADALQYRNFDRMVSAVTPIRDGGLLLLTETDIVRYDWQSHRQQRITALEAERTDHRGNDGKAGPDGSFWFGTMHKEAKDGESSFYRLDPQGQVERILAGRDIANGMAWTSDHRQMYFIDSPRKAVEVFDFDAGSRRMDNGRIAFATPEDAGVPDGMTIDRDDRPWVAHHGGKSLRCYDPADGRELVRVEVAAPFVTSAIFGGPDYDTLYITTAREGLTELEARSYPHCGGLFRVRTGARGRPVFCYHG